VRTALWPEVLNEDVTLSLALSGTSITRFGDGEIMLMAGESIGYNRFDPGLAEHLRHIAAGNTEALVCIPRIYASHRKAWVGKYERYGSFFPCDTYGSYFIDRPDSAPWTDNDDFRARVRQLWKGKDVTLVHGSETSLTPAMLHDARSVRCVHAPPKDAWPQVYRVFEEIGRPSGPVILCLGPTATVLAAWLADIGVQAFDLGMMGKFINRTKDSEPLPR